MHTPIPHHAAPDQALANAVLKLVDSQIKMERKMEDLLKLMATAVAAVARVEARLDKDGQDVKDRDDKIKTLGDQVTSLTDQITTLQADHNQAMAAVTVDPALKEAFTAAVAKLNTLVPEPDPVDPNQPQP